MKMAEIENVKLLKLLTILECFNGAEQISEDELTSLINSAITECKVPPLSSQNISYSGEDFDGVASNAEVQLSIISRLLVYVNEQKRKECQFSPVFLKNISVCCFLAACEYAEGLWEWSNQKTAHVSMNVMEELCKLHGCVSVKEFLTGNNQDHHDKGTRAHNVRTEDGCLKHILQRLSEMLTKNTWRSYPGLKMSYWSILQYLDDESIGEQLAYLLPPALFIVDDWEQKNKILGVKCLQYILDHTVGAELRWYGRASVIYDALKSLIHSREPEVLEVFYPAITQVARVLDTDPANSGKLRTDSRCDTLLEQLLREMAHEQKLTLRAIYTVALPPIVSAMGILAIRWSEELMNVCTDYLATSDGPTATDRLNILKGVQVYIRECWPRVHVQAECILKMVVRLIYDATLEDAAIDPQAIEAICLESENVIRLLHCAAPSTTKQLCQGLDKLSLHPHCECRLQRLMQIISSDN